MIRSGEEVLADIDATLDQLIQNAEAFRCISASTLLTNEMEALQKTQESLLARLLHMNDLLDQDQKRKQLKKQPAAYTTIEQKVVTFGRLNAEIVAQVSADLKEAKKPQPQRLRIRTRRREMKVSC